MCVGKYNRRNLGVSLGSRSKLCKNFQNCYGRKETKFKLDFCYRKQTKRKLSSLIRNASSSSIICNKNSRTVPQCKDNKNKNRGVSYFIFYFFLAFC